jgi:hypothetical protein
MRRGEARRGKKQEGNSRQEGAEEAGVKEIDSLHWAFLLTHTHAHTLSPSLTHYSLL